MTERMVFGVGFGYPGSVDYTVVGVFDTQEEAAEAAVREVEMYLDTFPGSTLTFQEAEQVDWWMNPDQSRTGPVTWPSKGVFSWLVYVLCESGRSIGYVDMVSMNADSPEAADYINAQEAN